MTTERPAPDPSAVEERRQKIRASGDRVRGDGTARWKTGDEYALKVYAIYATAP